MKHILSTTLVVLLSVQFAHSQIEQTIHQTFEMDEVSSLRIEIPGEYQIIPWASTSILTETHVQLFQTSPAILKHFVEKAKRYDLTLEYKEGTAILKAVDMKREPIKIRDVKLREVVVQKIYLPEKLAASISQEEELAAIKRTVER